VVPSLSYGYDPLSTALRLWRGTQVNGGAARQRAEKRRRCHIQILVNAFNGTTDFESTPESGLTRLSSGVPRQISSGAAYQELPARRKSSSVSPAPKDKDGKDAQKIYFKSVPAVS
jgi:hypothetical protein